MKKRGQPATRNKAEKDVAEIDAVVTRLKKRLETLGVPEKDVLDAATKLRERLLTEVYGRRAGTSQDIVP